MAVPQKYLTQKTNNMLTKARDKRAKVHSSGTKHEPFLPNSDKRRSKDNSNAIGGDGKHVEAAAKKSASQIKPNSRLYMSGRMCTGAKKLSPGEMALLEIDIFKPLDFYEILFNRTKESSNGRIISNLNEL